MHKDIVDTHRLKRRKELEQSLPSAEVVDADMVKTMSVKCYHNQGFNGKMIVMVKILITKLCTELLSYALPT